MVFVAVSETAMKGIPPQHAGMASGFLMTGHEVGAALGVAVLSAVATTAGNLTSPAGVFAGFSRGFVAAAVVAVLVAITALLKMPSTAPPAARTCTCTEGATLPLPGPGSPVTAKVCMRSMPGPSGMHQRSIAVSSPTGRPHPDWPGQLMRCASRRISQRRRQPIQFSGPAGEAGDITRQRPGAAVEPPSRSSPAAGRGHGQQPQTGRAEAPPGREHWPAALSRAAR